MDNELAEQASPSSKLPIIAVMVALIGLSDSVYLTVQHLTAAPVPCSIISGCETVLTSAYAEMAGVPTAAFGAAAYFAAFSLALLAAFGNRAAWMLFGVLSIVMAAFTLWLLYLQAFVIGAFCQFCLLSALTTGVLFVIAALSGFWRRSV
ncbi:MAG: vitamin K epoxide reductase family protein [Acidobacteria bacterium]|nr:vitamin K epoxide reductase family protein [Acidobacteriota bacterium]